MDEKTLKTSVWQRVVIIIVAILLLGSTVLTYMFIVMSSGNAKRSQEERLAELRDEYDAKSNEIQEAGAALSPKYFDELKSYRSQVKSFNAATANSEKLQIKDLKEGTGKQLGENDNDYMAYYIGWCPDGSLLDSSFEYAEDDEAKLTPLSLKSPLFPATMSLIEGWTQGVVGMKLGGIRYVSMPGEMAYGDTVGDRYCGMSNAPLRYVIWALPVTEDIQTKIDELNEIYYRLFVAAQGAQS